MRKRKRNRKQCHKVVYPTPEAARAALKKFGRDRGSKRFYKCPYHPGETVYHLTSEAKAV